MTAEKSIAIVAQTPLRMADGCSFGGEIMVVFEGCAMICRDRRIAEHITAAINAYKPIEPEDMPF